MKKLDLVFVLMFFVICNLNAQVSRGSWMLGGAGMLNRVADDKGYLSTNIQVSGSAGYFVLSKLAIGLKPSFSFYKGGGRSSYPYNYVLGNTGNSIGLGGFARYYFLRPDARVNVFSGLDYEYNRVYYRNNFQDAAYNISVFGLRAGAAVFVSSNVSLDLSLVYKNERRGEDKFKHLNFEVGFQFYLSNIAYR